MKLELSRVVDLVLLKMIYNFEPFEGLLGFFSGFFTQILVDRSALLSLCASVWHPFQDVSILLVVSREAQGWPKSERRSG